MMPRLICAAALCSMLAAAVVPMAASAQSDALGRAEQALKAAPRDPALRFAYGVALADAGRTSQAAEIFETLSQDHPELPDPLNNLAVLHAAQGRLDEARVALEAAVRNDPKHRLARENLGDVHLRLALRAWETLAAEAPLDDALSRKLRLGRELAAVRR